MSKRIGLVGNKLTKKQLEVRKRVEDRELERQFKEKCTSMFYYLCTLRDNIGTKAGFYKNPDQIEQDSLLILYYHDKAFHEYLLDGLLAGLLEEIDIQQKITYFYAAKGVVERWEKHLEKHPPICSESME